MSPAGMMRMTVFLGLCLAVPVMVWLLTRQVAEPDGSFRSQCAEALHATALIEALAAGLFSPWTAWQVGYRRGLGAMVLLNLIALPLYVLFWLGGAATPALILRLVGAGVAAAALCFACARGIALRMAAEPLSGIVLGSLQVVLVVAVWVFRSQWTHVIGV